MDFHYFINAFFFEESTIHKIYVDKGIFNFIYLVPFISYSFIISHTLNIIIKYIFLSEKNICEIKKEETVEKASDKESKVKKILIIKYICFFTIAPVFLMFLWYYLSSFGAVYQNTKIYLVKNALISFGFSMIYPFIINLLPGLFRLYSLKEKDRECFYKISKIIQFI